MSCKKIYSIIPYVFFISIFFESVCFFNIDRFSFTIPFFISIVLLFISFIYFIKNGFAINSRKVLIGSFLMLIILFSSLLSGYEVNFSSVLLYFYYLIFYLFVNPVIEENKLNKTISLFVLLASVFSIYGLYQSIAYNFNESLPLKELIPQNLLTPNYNTGGYAYLNGNRYYRAHSIYLEGSHFSQISAIAIGFTIFKKDYSFIKKIIVIILNLIGLFVSLSGTGLIIIIGIGVYWLVKNRSFKNLSVVLIVIFIVFILMKLSNTLEFIFEYYKSRSNELGVDAGTGNSGYYRLIIPIRAIGYIFENNIFGFGAGNDQIVANALGSPEAGIPNGFGKIIADAGVFGLLGFILLIYSLKPISKDGELKKVLFLITILFCLCGGSIVQVSFWCLSVLCLNTEKSDFFKLHVSKNEVSYECTNSFK